MVKALPNESPEFQEMIPFQVISGPDLEQLKNLLLEPKRIVITTHHKPDADAT
jgi:hypothetical protein